MNDIKKSVMAALDEAYKAECRNIEIFNKIIKMLSSQNIELPRSNLWKTYRKQETNNL